MSKITILLLVIAIIGISVGIGYALQKQEESYVITANDTFTSSEELICKCDVSKEDLLTETDVLRIVSDAVSGGLIIGQSVPGPQGEKGDKGDSPTELELISVVNEVLSVRKEEFKGDTGSQGLQGEKGDKGDMPLGHWERYCVSADGVEYYPIDKQCYFGFMNGEYLEESMLFDCCLGKIDGRIVKQWIAD